jgi:hypothetical protein
MVGNIHVQTNIDVERLRLLEAVACRGASCSALLHQAIFVHDFAGLFHEFTQRRICIAS